MSTSVAEAKPITVRYRPHPIETRWGPAGLYLELIEISHHELFIATGWVTATSLAGAFREASGIKSQYIGSPYQLGKRGYYGFSSN